MVVNFSFSDIVVNIKTAFFCGDHEEEIFMECPQEMTNMIKDDFTILNKCNFGLV